MLTKTQKLTKRIFDIALALLLLPVIVVLIFTLWLCITLSTGRNGWFQQLRIGRYGKPFKLFKLRTLKGTSHRSILEMKHLETPIGSWLRSTKLDELPQVFNILIGEMSFVGPRPDIPGYADKLVGDDRILLEVRPGLTGPATIKYRNEDSLLLQQENPEEYNDTVIWPDKVAINKKYVKNWSLQKDIKYLWASIFN